MSVRGRQLGAAARQEWLALGLMSGTSADGVDAALARFVRVSAGWSVELLAFRTDPYDDGLRDRLLGVATGLGNAAEVARLSFVLGRRFAESARRAVDDADVDPADLQVVGSHGHTVAHLPREDGAGAPATLQIGEAALIAERLRVPVVCDFRVRDMAAGGQGAPLVPYFDYSFLRSAHTDRVALNLGGIANITWMPAGCGLTDVVAFDTGPANMPIDAAMALLRTGGPLYDVGGAVAARGCVDGALLARLLDHPHFALRPPKSCGREEFGEGFVRHVLSQAPGLPEEDLLATLTELSGRTAGEAIARLASPGAEVVVSGGGVHNPVLMRSVERWSSGQLRTSDEFGIPADAKEAMAFAFLACETLAGRPANVPGATGATGPRVLGKITPP